MAAQSNLGTSRQIRHTMSASMGSKAQIPKSSAKFLNVGQQAAMRSSVVMNASASGAIPIQDPFLNMPSFDGVKQGVQNTFQQLSENFQNAQSSFQNADANQFGQQGKTETKFGQ